MEKVKLLNTLRSPDNRRVLDAVEQLRVRGWLEDGSLHGISLCHASFQNADLMNADLSDADLRQAHLAWADLSKANLCNAKLTRADLGSTNLSETIFAGADLFKVNFEGARNLTDAQLSEADRLWGAIMPDGETYDGRFNLAGDLEFARWGRVDVDDPEAMAQFYRVPLEVYLRGRAIASLHLVPTRG